MKIPSVIVTTNMTNVKEMFEDYFKQDIVNTISYEENFAVVSFVEAESELIELFSKNIGGGQVILYKNKKYVITPQYLDI